MTTNNPHKSSTSADETRQKILEAAAEEIYRVGFQAASLKEILKNTDVSKGAIYHHFPNKKELGYAVLDEIFATEYLKWVDPIVSAEEPFNALLNFMHNRDNVNELFHNGCPINNLAQEMSMLDEGFRLRIEETYISWQKKFSDAFKYAQSQGCIKKDVDMDALSWMLIAVCQGAMGLQKNIQKTDILAHMAESLSSYITTLQTTKK